MGNLDYCAFENTSGDLSQCVGILEEMVDNEQGINSLNMYEQIGAKSMYESCKEFIELYEQCKEFENYE